MFWGICLAFIGVFIARSEHYVHLQPVLRFPLYIFGVFVSFLGIALFASGLGRGK